MDKKYADTKILAPFLLLLVISLTGCGTTTYSTGYNSGYPYGWNRSQYGYNVVGYNVSGYPYYYSSRYSYPSYYVSPWAYGSYHTNYPKNAFTSYYHAPYTIYPNYSPYYKYRNYNYPVYYNKSVYSHPVVTPSYYHGGYKGYHH
jgi:hypothetical protein